MARPSQAISSFEEIAEGVRVDFTLSDRSETVTFDSMSEKDAATGCYKATCSVCTAEMSDKITAAITILKLFIAT